MKILLLMRHAKSSWDRASLADYDRPLNQRGKRDAPRMGQLVDQQDLVPDLIISSTAKRARKTAQKVAQACGYANAIEMAEELYHAAPEAWITTLHGVADHHTIVLGIGHNPGLEELVHRLTDRVETFPTAALAHVSLPIESWDHLTLQPTGTLVNLWRPRELE